MTKRVWRMKRLRSSSRRTDLLLKLNISLHTVVLVDITAVISTLTWPRHCRCTKVLCQNFAQFQTSSKSYQSSAPIMQPPHDQPSPFLVQYHKTLGEGFHTPTFGKRSSEYHNRNHTLDFGCQCFVSSNVCSKFHYLRFLIWLSIHSICLDTPF